ncbi:uncharacterized protein LOC115024021 [Cottoperca gobio]|uniref:Uncharacterized protein LOC115024021 n=1 Tax=Cottoperca gobio TaxID=56716 RepID=A0A6J2RPN8_COTGO|nr:uncharacterized protein LOC115024021 [Cottoperca gobio]
MTIRMDWTTANLRNQQRRTCCTSAVEALRRTSWITPIIRKRAASPRRSWTMKTGWTTANRNLPNKQALFPSHANLRQPMGRGNRLDSATRLPQQASNDPFAEDDFTQTPKDFMRPGETYDSEEDEVETCKPKKKSKLKGFKKYKAKSKAVQESEDPPGATSSDFMSEAAKAEWLAARMDERAIEGLEDEEEDGDTDSLMEWWHTVEQWDEVPSDDEDKALKEDESKSFTILADKVLRGLRVFNKLFTERAEVLWQSIITLHAIADDINHFHQKAKIAGITGGTTTAVGGVAAIAGLALAPFTLGVSLVITAVGVGVATAGGIASASAVISDNVNNMHDRKKVEVVLLEYEAQLLAIGKILHFVNQGLYKLRGHPFLRSGTQHYSRDWEIRQAVQMISLVDSPVLRGTEITDATIASVQGLFTGMDKFFAKDSRELKKGCKKEVVGQIKEVANVLNDGIVELNAIREELQDAIGNSRRKEATPSCSMNIFRRDKGSTAPTPVVPPRPSKEDLDNPIEHSLKTQDVGMSANREVTNELNSNTKRMGVMGVMQKVNPFKSTSQAPPTVSKAPSSESLEQKADSTQKPGVLRGVMDKVNPFKSTSQAPPTVSKAPSSESLEQKTDSTQKPGVLRGVMHKVNPFKSTSQVSKAASSESLEQGKVSESDQNPGKFKGMMQKVNPFKSYAQTSDEECQTDAAVPRITSSSLMQEQRSVHSEHSSSSDSVDDSTIERHSIWYSDVDPSCGGVKSQTEEAPKKRTMTFRIKRILPTALFGSVTKDSSSDTPALPQEVVEVETLEMAAVPSEGTVPDPLDDEEGLLAWWRIVEGWAEWSDANQDDEPEEVVEQAADRVFMAARLFVRFFNQRGASLQQRILELLALADSADIFHKKTVKASVGGGVASVAGSITTITGLILAPFTAGASLIVVAVGIGVATAGGVASASANITDTVHSKTDRKKVEKIIQDHEAEMKDIKECLEFLQEGMEALEEWNFEQYAESISKKHLNQNVKHVMKEGGRAGKALVINTESLINTVQVLTVAGGAAKAAQVMSITTGVMSGLFLALDVFFLAKDSMELKKGAKTEFAAKIREVCQNLQDGLLELNRIKEELQKTIDGIEVEVDEEEEDEELLKSELKKLVEFEE